MTRYSSDKAKVIRLKTAKTAQCNQRQVVDGPTERSVLDYMPKLRNTDFTLFSDSTVKSFMQSPWNLAKETDAFGELLHSKRAQVNQNLRIPEDGKPIINIIVIVIMF